MSNGRERLLVVDDEWTIRDILSGMLTAEGFAVETAADGEEAVNLIDDNDYALVITDLKMPKLDGIALLKHIQSVNADIVGIVATGYGTIESAIEAIRAGA